jgi:hypothetical protein
MFDAPSAVSARDATVRQSLKPRTEIEERVLCGARTRKGTPCRRLVQPGQRCAQHRGMASLLEKRPEQQTKVREKNAIQSNPQFNKDP